LLPDVTRETELDGVRVVVPATHDTASAVLAVPAASGRDPADWCYISSGTWSLMGVEIARPLLSEECRALNFTNEVGAGGTIRLLKNIAGLWLLQESRRIWTEQGNEHTWDELNHQAELAPRHASLVDPDHAMFLAPRDMPAAIRRFCERIGQAAPTTVGAVVRTVLDSLALKYRYVLEMLERLVGREIKTIHIVGGGAMNRPLCQAAANACARHVLAGPVEATVLGNVLQQAIAARSIASIAEGRALIAASAGICGYSPQDTAHWNEAFGRFRQIVELGPSLAVER
jgi:rhamnulokinase